MKERPILFSAPMVRAILAGKKTQTRRIFKNPEYYGCLTGDCPHDTQTECNSWMREVVVHECPYGVVSERLWVKETHAVLQTDADLDNPYPQKPMKPWRASVTYFADDTQETINGLSPDSWRESFDNDHTIKRPSIFMPRWASRITLEITGLRVERVQSISGFDARAEGYPADLADCDIMHFGGGKKARAWYRDLWTQINGAESWDANPLVWVVEFRRVQ